MIDEEKTTAAGKDVWSKCPNGKSAPRLGGARVVRLSEAGEIDRLMIKYWRRLLSKCRVIASAKNAIGSSLSGHESLEAKRTQVVNERLKASWRLNYVYREGNDSTQSSIVTGTQRIGSV